MIKRGVWSVVAMVVVAGMSATALGAEPREEVQAAVKKLAEGGNYSWDTTTTDSDAMTGATDGMTDRDGTTTFSVVQFQRTSPAVQQGGKLVVRMDDGSWKSLAEVAAVAAEARAAMMAARTAAATQEFAAEEVPRYEPILYSSLQNLKLPAVEMKELADRLQEVKKVGAVYTAALSPEVAADLLMNRRPGTGPASAPASAPAGRSASAPASAPAPRFRRPEPTKAQATATFTLKDGAVVKYEMHVSGTFVFGGEERPTDRTNTIEIKDIGTTKVTVPAEAKAKLATVAAIGPARP